MKRYLLLFIAASAIGMQQPPIVGEFYQAVRDGNLDKVRALISNPTIQNEIKSNQMYATEAVLKFPPRFPAMKDQYMQLARYLVTNGAKIDNRALPILEEYEKSQKNISPHPAIPKGRPLPATPAAAPVIPAQSPSQVISLAKQTPKASTSGQPNLPAANYQELQELIKQPIIKESEVTHYLNTHSLNTLSDDQKIRLLEIALGQVTGNAITSYKALKAVLRPIKMLQEKGVAPHTLYQKNLIADFPKGKGFSNRANRFSTTLVQAIRDKKSLAEIEKLVEHEDEDVNQAGTDQMLPLRAATLAGSKAIAEYLLAKGAKADNLISYERADLSKLLGRPV